MSSCKMKPCPVCGFMTLREDEIYDICPICEWEDDSIQADDPDFCGGANKLSLIAPTTKPCTVAPHRMPLCRVANPRNTPSIPPVCALHSDTLNGALCTMFNYRSNNDYRKVWASEHRRFVGDVKELAAV